MPDVLHCRIEIPRGSRNQYEWDDHLGCIKLTRFLFASVEYPTDYGFIPRTVADDGEPLDVMVLVSAPTFAGCIIAARPVALLRTRDGGTLDDKVLCVPDGDPGWNRIDDLHDVPRGLIDEITHFFTIYKQLDGITVEVDGWRPRADALEVIEAARDRWRRTT
jgi:inorganic pyrophosphatase